MKKIVPIIFSVILLISCDTAYDVGNVAPLNEARLIYVSIDDNYVSWRDQRAFYDHDTKVVTVQMLEGSFKDGVDLSAMIVYTAPVIGATLSPIGGQIEDWSAGERPYTVTSGDGSVVNDYTVKIVEVMEF